MRLKDTLGSLGRRWYFVVIGLLITGALCWVVRDRVPVNYEAQASLVLMPPKAVVGDQGNPYLALGGMSQALDVLTRHVQAPDVQEPVLKQFSNASYTIEPDRTTSGSMLLVKATGSDTGPVLDILAAAVKTVPVSLKAMQDELSVIPKSRISVMTVVTDSEATADTKQMTQLTIVAAAGGIVATVLVTGLLDGLLVSRRNRRNEGRPSEDDENGVGGEPTTKHEAEGAALDPANENLEAAPAGNLRPRTVKPKRAHATGATVR